MKITPWLPPISALLAVSALTVSAVAAPLSPAAPLAPTLDGVRDSSYTLLATDPDNDLANPGPGAWSGTTWTDLRELYVQHDTNALYVYLPLPNYALNVSSGEIGLTLDFSTTAGGPSDPWGRAITYAYTGTNRNVSGTPVNHPSALLPDVVIRGNIPGLANNPPDQNNGWTELRRWDGSNFNTGLSINWGGLANGQQVGPRIAYANGQGVELMMPWIDMGLSSAPSVINVQFYTTQKATSKGAFDTVPSDDQSTGWDDPTTQRHYATYVIDSGPVVTPTGTPTAGPSPTATSTPTPTSTPNPGAVCGATVIGDGVVTAAGLYHLDTDPLMRQPQGNIEIGSSATLKLRTCANDVQGVSVLVWRTGDPLAAPSNTYALSIDSSDANYITWTVNVPAPTFVIDQWYQFRITDASTQNFYRPVSGNTGIGQWQAALGNPSWRLGTTPPPPAAYDVPDWLQDAVIYQVFPDRFRDGNPANNPPPFSANVRVYGPTTCQGYPHGRGSGPACVVDGRAWQDGYAGSLLIPSYGIDFYGGDLRGIIQKLDEGYFTQLGVNVLYLNPIFESSSNHGYDTNDFYAIASRFGTPADFTELMTKTQALGIRVILDAVFNHAGSDSRYMDGYGLNRYPDSTGACEGVVPYRSWFTPGGSGSGCADGWTWKGWYGYETIPEFIENDSTKDFFFRGGSAQSPSGVSVQEFWINQGIAGWRYDVAQDITLQWFAETRPFMKTSTIVTGTGRSGYGNNDIVMLGEVTGGCDWGLYRNYLNPNGLDTTMNYCFRDAAVSFANGNAPSAFVNYYTQFQAQMPANAFNALMNLISSHDSPRMLNKLSEDKSKLKLAVLLQMTMPGAPSIYYGDEVGLSGGGDPDNRRTYPWADRGGSPDLDMLHHFTTTVGIRNTYPALRRGTWQNLLVSDAQFLYAFMRATPTQKALVILNNGTAPQNAVVPVSGQLADGTTLVDVLNGGTFTVTGGQVAATVNGRWGRILIANTDLPPASVQFSAASASALEDSGAVTVTVTLSEALTQTASVNISSTHGSANASDYTPLSTTLTFTPGTTSQQVVIALTADGVDELNETFEVSLSAPTNANLGTPSTVVVTIVDDDGVSVVFATDTLTVSEAAGTVPVVVMLNTTPAQTVTVMYASAPSADIVAASGTLTFAPGGPLTQTLMVTLINDTQDELTETVTLSLTNPVNADLGLPSVLNVVIVDDDEPAVALSASAYTATEGAGSVLITVTLDQPPALTVTVAYAAAPGTADATDFTPASGTLTFAPGQTTRTFSVLLADDVRLEPTETVLLSLSAPVNATLGAPANATLFLTDNDFGLFLPLIQR